MTSPFINETQTIIVVMGTTGVGKSTFINYATNGGARIGNNLTACTADCAAYPIPNSDVWLIDTPGFDDTYKSDAKILEEINRCLSENFEKRARVTGVLYVHAITETRMKGSAMKNLRMFRQMVGSNNMSHCCLVTTKWSRQSEDLSRKHEAELQTNKTFWKPLIDKGAHITQFKDSYQSAMQIILPLSRCPRFHMKITEEYNMQGKELNKTAAGREVFDDIEQAKKEHQQEIEALKGDWKIALEEKDLQMQKMIKAEQARLQKEMDQMREGQEILQKKFADEKLELEQKIERDRLIQARQGAEFKEKLKRGAVRVVTGGIAASAIVLSGGILTAPAVVLYAGVESALQDQKDANGY